MEIQMLDRCSKHGMIGLWMRAPYIEGFRDQIITAVVRQGDRTDFSDSRHMPADEDVAVRFIKSPGDASRKIEAVLFPDDGTTVRRVGVVVKRIKDLTEKDLQGTAPDSATPELVRYHLAMIGNNELPPLESLVTVWKFVYQPKAMD